MIIAAVAIALHWVAWPLNVVQMGVATGEGNQERLLAMVPAEGCGAGIKFYTGHYGEMEHAVAFIEKSKVCQEVERRAKLAEVLKAESFAFIKSHPWVIAMKPMDVTGARGNKYVTESPATWGQFADEKECGAEVARWIRGKGHFINMPVPAEYLSCVKQ